MHPWILLNPILKVLVGRLDLIARYLKMKELTDSSFGGISNYGPQKALFSISQIVFEFIGSRVIVSEFAYFELRKVSPRHIASNPKIDARGGGTSCFHLFHHEKTFVCWGSLYQRPVWFWFDAG
jgi:hypothetical protein